MPCATRAELSGSQNSCQLNKRRISIHKVKYDRPGECSPEKDCLR